MEREIKDDFIDTPTKYEALRQEFERLREDRKYLREWAMENGEDKRLLPGAWRPGARSYQRIPQRCGCTKELINRPTKYKPTLSNKYVGA